MEGVIGDEQVGVSVKREAAKWMGRPVKKKE